MVKKWILRLIWQLNNIGLKFESMILDFTWVDFVPNDTDVVITIWTTLFVPETKSMNKLVGDGANNLLHLYQ